MTLDIGETSNTNTKVSLSLSLSLSYREHIGCNSNNGTNAHHVYAIYTTRHYMRPMLFCYRHLLYSKDFETESKAAE